MIEQDFKKPFTLAEVRRLSRMFSQENRTIARIEIGHAQARELRADMKEIPIYSADGKTTEKSPSFAVDQSARVYGVRVVYHDIPSSVVIIEQTED